MFLTRSDAVPYGSYLQPEDLGSGGGGDGGGRGGGAVIVNASDAVKIYGVLSADGGDATSGVSGGGSGGGISIDCDRLIGNGVISARGGSGFGGGGGGSGGRITITHELLQYTGRMIADGGITGNLRLKIKLNDWLLADTCPQAANHCALF